MTRIDKAKEHKQPAGQTSRELAGLIAAIEAEFDSHIASDLPGHQNFRKSMIRRALAIVKKRKCASQKARRPCWQKQWDMRIFQLWPGLFGRAIFFQISSRFCQTGFFAMCAQNWKSPILAF